MEYKLICSDLDGTLLKDEMSICEENIVAIKKAIKKGVKFVIVTGRTYVMCKYLYDVLDIEGEIITSNGGCIVDTKTKKVLYKKTFDLEYLFQVVDVCNEFSLPLYFHTMDSIIVDKKAGSFPQYEKTLEANNELNIIEALDIKEEIVKQKDIIVKCIALSGDFEKVEKVKSIISTFEGLEVTSSGKDNFEVNPIGITKGSGIKFLRDMYNLKSEEIIAIGDNDNDLSMIKCAGLGVAVKNAKDTLKKEANYITEKNHDQGAVAEVINKFVLGE